MNTNDLRLKLSTIYPAYLHSNEYNAGADDVYALMAGFGRFIKEKFETDDMSSEDASGIFDFINSEFEKDEKSEVSNAISTDIFEIIVDSKKCTIPFRQHLKEQALKWFEVSMKHFGGAE